MLEDVSTRTEDAAGASRAARVSGIVKLPCELLTARRKKILRARNG
jgi:hypothetical protein